ncbi:DUF262 domain-containing protein [bacterium]|nr:DUF262 domain-containing protein [bacterium]
MLNYEVRSDSLLSIINDIKDEKLVLSPYFQRNMVWRDLHKQEFIKTILLGYPFPQIFISRGTIDVNTMQATYCVVDGQQRLGSIMEFIENKFDVEGRFYEEMSEEEKGDFFKYKVAIIELDMHDNDKRIIDIFNRLNRTYFSLTMIEKLATEFAPSEFMIVAKLLSGELNLNDDEDKPMIWDPNVPKESKLWAKKKKVKSYKSLMLDDEIFTSYELSRKVHLMFTLNLMSTIIGGYYNRNDNVKKNLELYSSDFEYKDVIVDVLELLAAIYKALKLPEKSYWRNKSNWFSLMCVLYEWDDEAKTEKLGKLREKLLEFEKSVPEEYTIAAKEAVNNKRERMIRHKYIMQIIESL